ncbi:MAG: HAMP domain-containing histidine kinase [Prolixibacteraceae bacterium]|nr:HAMP domain-containing histidine kinase [Prolixibacteraceae bacterium]
MKRFANRIVSIVLHYISNTEFKKEDELPYWRERIFNSLILALFLFGSLAIVPNLIASLNNKAPVIFIVDLLLYLVLLFLFIFKKVKLKVKVILAIVLVYVLSMVLLVGLGPMGPGFVWLASTSVVAALLLGTVPALITIGINLLLIFYLYILIRFNVLSTPFFETYTAGTWIAVSLNVIIFNAISSIPVSFLLRGLNKTLKKEKKLKLELVEKNRMIEKEIVKERESNRLKTDFLSNLSHEIKNPMNAIAGFSDLIKAEDNLPEHVYNYSDHLVQNSTYLNNLVGDLLNLSLIEVGEVKMNIEKFSLQDIFSEVESVLEVLPVRKKRKNVELSFVAQPGLLKSEIISDKTHIQQILLNLVTNALKYTPEGRVEIGFTIDKNFIEFYVKDTGVGIPASEQEKIFSRFAKIDREKKLNAPGLGIGLSICKGLTSAMGGEIWFESEENKGTCFHFSIPLG